MTREPLLTQLLHHRAADPTEAAHQARLSAFVGRVSEPFSRATREGHVTGSAVAVDTEGERLFLLWHVKLQRWLQPGGHCEPGTDTDVSDTAWRELLEETETGAADWTLVQPLPFDLDVHPIPARGVELEHLHYDVRYLFRARPRLELERVGKWVTLAEVAALPDASLARLARKLIG